MNLEKRVFLASLLSLAILLLFSSLYKPPQKNSLLPQTISPEKTAPTAKKTTVITQLPACPAAKAKKVDIGNFSLTICTTGGYIKDISVRRYHDQLLFHNLLYTPALKDKTFSIENAGNKISLTYKDQQGYLRKEIVLKSDFSFEFKIINKLNKDINKVLLAAFAKDKGFYSRYEEFFYKNDDLTKRLAWSKIRDSREYAFRAAAGLRSRYYALVVFKLPRILLEKEKNNLLFWETTTLKPNNEWSRQGFLGPQDLTLLTPLKLSWIVNYGLFNPISIITLKALNFSHRLLKNWGLSIIVLSILIYFLLFPLSAAGFKSMSKMQLLQPKLEELKLKYKGDAQKLNRATLELYKKEGVNPLGGCLPMLLQIPVFFAFYQALIRSVEIKGARFLWIKDLSKPDYFIKLPAKMPLIGDGVHLLPIIMALIMFFQQKLTSGRSGTSSEQQKMMTMILPLVFGFIFYNFPAGLVLYWLINNLLGFIYQYKISRQLNPPA